MNAKEFVLILSHDVSQEMRDDHGRWSGGGCKAKKKKGKPASKKKKKGLSTKHQLAIAGGILGTQIGVSEAIRHKQKDALHISHLQNQLKNIKQQSISPDSWRWMNETQRMTYHTEKNLKIKRLENAIGLHKRALSGKVAQKLQRKKDTVKQLTKVKKQAVRGTKLGIKGLLHLGVLVKYHAQKAINKFGRPQKIAGLLTHIK